MLPGPGGSSHCASTLEAIQNTILGPIVPTSSARPDGPDVAGSP